jgi:uncharacterized protein YjiS (DUF1127 family)
MTHAAPSISEAPVEPRPGIARPNSGMGPFQRLLSLAAALRNRRRLARLPGYLLEDVGLTPEEAAAEARRPPWDVPSHWRSSRPCRALRPLTGRTGS